jgi:hypothetical protein
VLHNQLCCWQICNDLEMYQPLLGVRFSNCSACDGSSTSIDAVTTFVPMKTSMRQLGLHRLGVGSDQHCLCAALLPCRPLCAPPTPQPSCA